MLVAMKAKENQGKYTLKPLVNKIKKSAKYKVYFGGTDIF